MGYRPITTILNRTGFSVSGPTVLKYMREMGISAIYPKPNLSKKNHEHTIACLTANKKSFFPNPLNRSDWEVFFLILLA
jgi:putative transposase